MNGFRDISEKIKQAIAALEATQLQRATGAAHDVFALVQNRIINSGENSQGGRIPGYSTTQVPKYFFHNRSRNAGADTRVKKSKAKTLSYQQFRQLNNLQVDHVDLFFTGEMWRGTGVTVTPAGKGIVRATLEGKTTAAEKKIDWNSQRYGESILTPSPQELAAAEAAYQAATLKILEPIFNL